MLGVDGGLTGALASASALGLAVVAGASVVGAAVVSYRSIRRRSIAAWMIALPRRLACTAIGLLGLSVPSVWVERTRQLGASEELVPAALTRQIAGRIWISTAAVLLVAASW